MTLARQTGWPLSELLAISVGDLFTWLKACPLSLDPRHAPKPRP